MKSANMYFCTSLTTLYFLFGFLPEGQIKSQAVCIYTGLLFFLIGIVNEVRKR